MADSFDQQALLILAHGSGRNPSSSKATKDTALAIEKKGIFASVHCAFWKEKPDFQDVWDQIEERHVYVVPNFVSEGYFTREVIPRELNLSGAITQRANHLLHYCDPVGLHPGMTRLLINRANQAAGISPDNISLILVGHGTEQSSTSTLAIQNQVEEIRQLGIPFKEVIALYLDEPPFLSDWESLTSAPHVVAVPFFISEGLHTQEDIPRILELETNGPLTQIAGKRTIHLTSPVGVDPAIPEMIIDQVLRFKNSMGKR